MKNSLVEKVSRRFTIHLDIYFHFVEMLGIEVTPAGVVSINETDEVQFSCTLTCGCSGTNLMWVRQDGSPLHPSAQVFLSHSERTVFLHFDNVSREADGVYVCVATHSELGRVTEQVELNIIFSGTHCEKLSLKSHRTDVPDALIKTT